MLSLNVGYIDGTKIESKANKYTFVWRKTVEKNKAKLQAKVSALLKQIDDVIIQDKIGEEESTAITASVLSDIVSELKESLKAEEEKEKEQSDDVKKKELTDRKKQIKVLESHAEKLSEYDKHLEVLGARNSYSKTDHDATFMRMKEDAMCNGQTKPGYNLQIGTENQYITDFALFPNPTDTTTMIPFTESYQDRYYRYPNRQVADSGYGSEENYHFMEEHVIEPFVKYNYFHKEHRPRYALCSQSFLSSRNVLQ